MSGHRWRVRGYGPLPPDLGVGGLERQNWVGELVLVMMGLAIAVATTSLESRYFGAFLAPFLILATTRGPVVRKERHLYQLRFCSCRCCSSQLAGLRFSLITWLDELLWEIDHIVPASWLQSDVALGRRLAFGSNA
jgi:hypothetical protein